jgi:exonuclease VII small subunit
MNKRATRLDEAKSFLEEAFREFERGVKENSMTLVRDASEKA